MIFYATLLFYALLLIISVILFLVRKFSTKPVQIALAFPLKNSFHLFSAGRVKISRFITQYECPDCGYKSMEPSKHCPHCKNDGKKIPLLVKTMPFQG